MIYTKFPYTASSTSPRFPRLNVRSIRKIPMNGDVTIRNGHPVQYQTGYQVCVAVHPFATAEEVSRFLHTEGRKGQYTIRHSQTLWFVDEHRQVPTKKAALALARNYNRLTIYGWAKNEIIRC